MSIFSKVTLKTLGKNRVRTAVTVVGILLSAAMITAVTTSVSSFQRYLQDVMVALEGRWHVAFFNVDAQGREDLESDGRVDSAAWAQVSWAHVTGDPAYRDEDYTLLCAVLGADETFMERMPVSVSSGRLPENPGEIALSQIDVGGVTTQLGGTVTLDLGNRVQNGRTLGFNNGPLLEGETLDVRQTRTFTVVGYLSDTRFARKSGAQVVGLTCWDEQDTAALQNGYLLLGKARDVYDVQSDYLRRFGTVENDDYLMTLGVSRYDTFNTVLYSFAAILIGLIMFGSVSLIYNAFSISVAERTKQFGLLRSVGATKKQIRSMVFTEALAVSAVGIPLGILAGMLGMAVTFRFIGGSLGNLLSDGVGFRASAPVLNLRATPVSIIAAAAIGLVTVLISAWIPSRRAMRVSAIEAIRQSADVRIRPREVKTGKLTYKLFGLEGAIAGKHFKRNRKSYRATVVSLFMSVVLFVSASSFCRYLTDMVMAVFDDNDYDISYSRRQDVDDPDEGVRDLPAAMAVLSQAPGVTGATGFIPVVNTGGHYLPQDLIPQRTREVMAEYAQPDGTFYVPIAVMGVEESSYRAYLNKLGLPAEEFLGEDPKIIVRTTVRAFNSETQRMESFEMIRPDVESLELGFTDEYALEELWASEGYEDMTPEEQDAAMDVLTFRKTYEVGCVTDELPLGLNGNNDRTLVTVLMPLSEARRVQEGKNPYEYIRMRFTVSDPQNGLANILAAAESAGLNLDKLDFLDIYAETIPHRSIITVVRVISYGFIILISAIAALNVFNTISTNILLRRREFAMLRSVGMTNRGFNRMMNFECLLYGAKSLLFGIPASIGVTYLIFLSARSGMDTGFYLPWSALFIAVGSVFLVVFLSMMYSMAGIKRDNPIEAMKNEVI